MKIILVSVGNFQEYILDNIYNLSLFGNCDVTVITNAQFFEKFRDLPIPVELVDCNNLSDGDFNMESKLDQSFRNGFWHLCSLRLFYVYSYMKTSGAEHCIHLENDVLTYVNFDAMQPKFKENKVYATFDSPTRVIPGILYIPNHAAFAPIIDNYNGRLNDMENLARFDKSVILPLPIFPSILPGDTNNNYTTYFHDFQCIFDAAAMGQYLGGVNPENQPGDTRGFVNETCVVKYNAFKFEWIACVVKYNDFPGLFIPTLIVNNKRYNICNLHIHSKRLTGFLANNPDMTNQYITRADGEHP